MYGIEAINEADGWNLAILGISIVFFSLIILSIVIAQLHKVLDLFKKKQKLCPANRISEKSIHTDRYRSPVNDQTTKILENTQAIPHPEICLENIDVIAASYEPLLENIDDPFQLSALYKEAEKHDFPHPHLTISCLRWANILVPVDNHLFTFKRDHE